MVTRLLLELGRKELHIGSPSTRGIDRVDSKAGVSNEANNPSQTNMLELRRLHFPDVSSGGSRRQDVVASIGTTAARFYSIFLLSFPVHSKLWFPYLP